MRRSRVARSVFSWELALELVVPPGRATAGLTDGSTLHSDRGRVEAPRPEAAGVAADAFAGAARLPIPIALPPGTGGLTPELALVYSSASRSDSWVGFGWSLGGSTIARSLRKGVPSYDDVIDAFELDGQELVPEDANPQLPREYHTRIENFVRIVHEADGSWTVTRKDGSRLRFGVTSDARIERAPGETFHWLVSEEEDPSGNVVRWSYDRSDPGTAYPAEIRYTLRRNASGTLESLDGDPSKDRLVSFVLESRPDVPESYAAGFLRRLAHRLARIDVCLSASCQAPGTLLRRYDLRYAQSADTWRTLLDAVALYGTDAAAANPTPPFVTSFHYRSNVAGQTTGWAPATWAWPSGVSVVDSNYRDGGTRIADVDGDALPDLIKAHATYSFVTPGGQHSADSGVYLSTGAGFGAKSTIWTLPVFSQQDTGAPIPFAFVQNLPVSTLSTGLTVGNGTVPIDLTGDGRVDFINLVGGFPETPAFLYSPGPLPQGQMAEWCKSTPTGFSCLPFASTYHDDYLYTGKLGYFSNWFSGSTPASQQFFSGNAQFAELNGDGLVDILVRGREFFYNSSLACVNGTTFSYPVYNQGDLQLQQAPLSSAPPPIPSGCSSSTTAFSTEFQPCDLANGTSCERALFASQSQLYPDLPLATVAGFMLFDGHQDYGNVALDVNGDGLADWLSATEYFGSTTLGAVLNDGAKGYVSGASWKFPAVIQRIGVLPQLSIFGFGVSLDTGIRFADVNGDGRVDAIQAVAAQGPKIWLNDGDVDESTQPTPWRTDHAWALPMGIAITGSGGNDLGTRFDDVDGDGMIDIVQSQAASQLVYLSRGEVPDLLEEVTTPLGGITRLEYTPSTAFDNTGGDGVPDLPQVLQLLTKTTSIPGHGQPNLVTTYAYAGGVYDPPTRELRGFRQVSVTAPNGVVSTFVCEISGEGLELGEA
jgi:hypothetical protein